MYDDCRHVLKSTLLDGLVTVSHWIKGTKKQLHGTVQPGNTYLLNILKLKLTWSPERKLVGRFDKPNISFGRIFLLKAMLVLGVPKRRETQFTCKIHQRKHEWPWPHGDNFQFTGISNELEKGDPFRVGMKAETSLGQTNSLRYKKYHYPLIMGCKKDFKNY